jgi:hypothetical protein
MSEQPGSSPGPINENPIQEPGNSEDPVADFFGGVTLADLQNLQSLWPEGQQPNEGESEDDGAEKPAEEIPPILPSGPAFEGPDESSVLEPSEDVGSPEADPEPFVFRLPEDIPAEIQPVVQNVEFVGAAQRGQQRRKNKYICVGGRNRIDHDQVKIGDHKKNKWVPLGYNTFNANDYWDRYARWKRKEPGATKPRLPKLYYLSIADGKVRRNDLTEGQKQRCLGLMPPCKPGEDCPGELVDSKRRESTLQGKRRIPLSETYQDKIREGKVAEPARIIGCLEADDDLGGVSRGDANPWRSFKTDFYPGEKKLKPNPPPDYPIDVCEPGLFQQWLADDNTYPEKPVPGNTVTQTIEQRDNRQFSTQPFQVSLFWGIMHTTNVAANEGPVSTQTVARFIQKCLTTALPAPFAPTLRQLYLNPDQNPLVLPADPTQLNVDLREGVKLWNEGQQVINDLAQQFQDEIDPVAGRMFSKMMRISFAPIDQDGRTQDLTNLLRKLLYRSSVAAANPIPGSPNISLSAPPTPAGPLSSTEVDASGTGASPTLGSSTEFGPLDLPPIDENNPFEPIAQDLLENVFEAPGTPAQEFEPFELPAAQNTPGPDLFANLFEAPGTPAQEGPEPFVPGTPTLEQNIEAPTSGQATELPAEAQESELGLLQPLDVEALPMPQLLPAPEPAVQAIPPFAEPIVQALGQEIAEIPELAIENL